MSTQSAHWAFLTEGGEGLVSRIFIVDGDSQRMVGMIASGFLPHFLTIPKQSEYVLGETYWSRGSRGTRSDFITYYDFTTLKPLGETPLPEGRFLIGKRFALQLTGDGRYVLSANATPATSVSIVDLVNRTRLSAVTTPGCALVLPHGPHSFSTLCANGAFMTVKLNPDGTAEKVRGEPFFNPDVDPVWDDWALSRQANRAFFISFHGQVYPVDLAGDAPRPAEPAWYTTSAHERSQGWRPGGAEPIEYHAPSHRLFVLMHRGAEWTQFASGTEVWVFDATTHQRLTRIQLSTPAQAIAVTRDDAPLLFISGEKGRLFTYRARGTDWERIGQMDEMGTEASRLTVPEP
jgi:methylamine dehydrogenase heavy chain